MITPQSPSWPLDGIRVLDLGQIYNGSYAGFLLAHAGADVVKVEPPRGDPLRTRAADGSKPLAFAMLNSNKRGLSLNLKTSKGRDVLLKLAAEADVLLENYTPGTLTKLGVGPERLMAINPKLVYASSTGYGLHGPLRDNLAMDLTVQAIGGVMSINGPSDGPPLKAGLAICDFLGGVHLYSGIVTALMDAQRTGQGRQVEVAMLEALYPALATNLSAMHTNQGRQPERRGNRHPARGAGPYNVYRCKDGHIAVTCSRDTHWDQFILLMKRPELADDERFNTNSSRARHDDELNELVGHWTSLLTQSEALEALAEYRIPAAPVRELDAVMRDEHMHVRGTLHDVQHAQLGEVVLPTSPLKFSATPKPEVRPDPELGEHTDEVLSQWLSATEADVRSWREEGAFS